MHTYSYSPKNANKPTLKKAPVYKTKKPLFLLFILLSLFVGWLVIRNDSVSVPIIGSNEVKYSENVSIAERELLESTIKDNLSGNIVIKTATSKKDTDLLVDVYVPVTAFKSSRQKITSSELKETSLYFLESTDDTVRSQIASVFGSNLVTNTVASLGDIDKTMTTFIPVGQLNNTVKLLALDDNYYLDNFSSGALFRIVEGNDLNSTLQDTLFELPQKDTTLTINQTGVTALTRIMIQKLNAVNDANYFSKNIGDFLSDADITHVSNEVSFMNNCPYSHTAFCSDYRFIDTLKSSGVDVVELTGNHNNDLGSQNNTDSINLYHSLGWGTFGGGLNTEDAQKPYEIDKKSTKVALLGYNYADAPASGAIAGQDSAGANPYDAEQIRTDIKTAKDKGKFVIVDVQFWECYAYPDGYVEFPECDLPIGQQEKVFKSIIDAGADMVVGTQAHQPQTYELYNDKPIYYGLGNLYFDQTYWPGTERGIILTHYFFKGKILQTKLTPTVYHDELQTKVMNVNDQETFLSRFEDL